MSRIGVTGGRDNYDYFTVDRAIRDFVSANDVLVHGAAAGIDSLSAFAAKAIWGIEPEAHPANWTKYGKAAGSIRNGEMVASGLDLLLVFEGHYGTKNMVDQANKAGIECVFIEVEIPH